MTKLFGKEVSNTADDRIEGLKRSLEKIGEKIEEERRDHALSLTQLKHRIIELEEEVEHYKKVPSSDAIGMFSIRLSNIKHAIEAALQKENPEELRKELKVVLKTHFVSIASVLFKDIIYTYFVTNFDLPF